MIPPNQVFDLNANFLTNLAHRTRKNRIGKVVIHGVDFAAGKYRHLGGKLHGGCTAKHHDIK